MKLKLFYLDNLPVCDTPSGWYRHVGITHPTLIRAEKNGDLTIHRTGPRSVLIYRADLLKWLGVDPALAEGRVLALKGRPD